MIEETRQGCAVAGTGTSRPPADRSQAARAFIVTPYVVGSDGRLAAQIPSRCPAVAGPAEADCCLVIEHHRRRKTGPSHPLTMLSCRRHGCAFTLYPPGYAPYLRQAVLQVAPDGQPIRSEGDQERTDFSGTVFQAALDAKRSQQQTGNPSAEVPSRRRSTLRRHLRLAAGLVGVARDLGERVRCSIATVLSVATLQLIEGSRTVGYRGIGEAVCAVLSRLRGGARGALRLLVCGHLAGRWGEPLHWDPQRLFLERSPFGALRVAP